MMGNKQQQWAWAFYDWANSVYSLVITTAIFPLYFGAIIPSNQSIQLLGLEFANKDVLYSYSISFSFVLVVLISPILSSIADAKGNKKFFLKLFCYLGSASCLLLFFFTKPENLWIGILFSVLASLGFWGSLVYYNAYLPEIASEQERDALSAKGFSMGYIGSVILLLICLGLILGIDKSFTRYSFLLVGIWWAGFAQYTFYKLPKARDVKSKPKSKPVNVYQDLISMGKELAKKANINLFLLAFFCLSVGVQTIIYTATRFGDEELKLDSTKLIVTILLIQLVAIFGAWLFAKVSFKLGNIVAMQLGLLVWALISVGAFLLDKNNANVDVHFYILGGFVGLVLGGIQSLSRSTYSKLIPKEGDDNTKYFSFYDIVEKIALILGTFVYGFLIFATGSMRFSALALGLFFVLAALLLFGVKLYHKTKE